jgi:signal transduction histidine kinase
MVAVATLAYPLSAQKRPIDSLRHELTRKHPPLERIELLCEIGWQLYDVDDSLAVLYSRQALQEATLSNYAAGLKRAYLLVGLGEYTYGNYAGAIDYLQKSIEYPGNNVGWETDYAFILLGNIMRDQANFEQAWKYYERADSLLADDTENQALLWKNKGKLRLRQWRNAEAYELLKRAEALATQKVLTTTLYDIWASLGEYHLSQLEYAQADAYFDKLFQELIDKPEEKYYRVKGLLHKAQAAFRLGNFSQSLSLSFDALHISESYKYRPQQAEVFAQIGDVYAELSQFDLSSRYFFEALKIAEQFNLRQLIANCQSSIAWNYKMQLDFATALDYLAAAERIRKEIGDEHGLSNCQNIRGLIFMQQRKYNEALAELESALQVRERIDHKQGISDCLFNLGLVYLELKDFSKAASLQLRCASLEEQLGNIQGMAISYNSLANIYMQAGEMGRAREYLNKAFGYAQQTGSKILLRDCYQVGSQLYERSGKLSEALRYARLYQQVDDSIYTASSSVKLAEMQALYQVQQKEQQIDMLNNEKALREAELEAQQTRLRLQNILIGASIAGLMLISTLAFTYYRYNRKIRKTNHEIIEQKEEIESQSEELREAYEMIALSNRQLEEKIEDRTSQLKQAFKELDTFFYRSSHDFRRPITTFLGLAEVAKITVKDTNALELFSKVRETAQSLDKMLMKLQSISDLGAQQLVYKEVFVRELIDQTLDTYRVELNNRNIQVTINARVQAEFYSYPAMIKLILDNLVENAINFCRAEHPTIDITAHTTSDCLNLIVSDNGQGIDAAYHHRIFDMYFRANERSKGNGLGLYITKKAVEKLNGEISFESAAGQGCVFKVIVPSGEKLLS